MGLVGVGLKKRKLKRKDLLLEELKTKYAQNDYHYIYHCIWRKGQNWVEKTPQIEGMGQNQESKCKFGIKIRLK